MLRRSLPGAVGLISAAVLLLGMSGLARADEKALILHATRGGESQWTEFLRKKINDTGLYPDGVDDQDIAYRDPSLGDLQNYKLVVVIASDFGINSGTGTGNALGSYMDMVPGAAVLLFYPYTWQTGLFGSPAITGTFANKHALTTQSATASTAAAKLGMTLGDDPLMSGVMPFTCGANCKRLTGQSPKPGATVAAFWDDGSLLAIHGKNRVDLNMWPVGDSIIAGSVSVEAERLITNSIVFLSSPLSSSPQSYTFPPTPLGLATAPQTITFTNSSKAPVEVSGIGIDGPNKGSFTFKALKTPPFTIDSGSSFTVNVSYQPKTQGMHSATLYASLTGFARAEVPVAGSSKGNLLLQGTPIDFGGIPSGTTAGPTMITISNVGAAPVNMDKPVIQEGGMMTTHYELVPFISDDHVTLVKGATYRFTLKFVPGMTGGEYPGVVTITSSDPSSPLTIPVRGLAGPPKLDVQYMSLLMPDVALKAAGLPVDVLLTNSGNSDLKVTDIVSSGPDFKVLNPPSMMAPIVIKARDNYIFQIVFSPQDKGLRTGKVTIKTNEPPPMGGTSDKVITLAGSGTSPAFQVNATSIDFGDVNLGKVPATKTLTLSNSGDGRLTVNSIEIVTGLTSGSFGFGTTDPVPFQILPGDSVDMTVTLTPRQAGALSAVLRIKTDAAMMGMVDVNLKANANGSVGGVSPKQVDFGDQKVKASAKKTVTITNTGNKPLTIQHSRVQNGMGMNAFAANLPKDGTAIAPPMMGMGGTLTFDVTFSPTVVGAATGSIVLDTDDPVTSQFVVQLSGNGVTANVSISPTVIDFDPLYIGQKSDGKSVKIRNIGSTAIDNLTVQISGPDAANFLIANAGKFKTMLMPNDSSEVIFAFSPQVAKVQLSATAIVQADGVNVPMMINLRGSSSSPMITVQPDNLHFAKQATGASSAPQMVTLVNNGTSELNLELGMLMSQDFQIDSSNAKLKLGAGESTQFAVTFSPQTTGQKSEMLEVRLKGSVIVAGTVAMDGEGVEPMAPPPPPSGCSAAPGRVVHAGTVSLFALLLLGGVLLLRRRRV